MKVANIACAWPPYAGGIAVSARQIGAIIGAAHEVADLTPAHLKPWLKYGHGAFMPQLLWRLRGFDYIYLHYPFFGTAEIVWLFKIFAGVRPKLIIHYHMDVRSLALAAKLLSLPSRLIARRLFRQADMIVSASLDYVKHGEMKKYFMAHPEKFREIPFGLDLENFRPKLINRPTDNKIIARAQEIIHYVTDTFIKRDRLRFLFVGGLDKAHYFKGLPVLLEALPPLPPERWRLKIVGDGDLRPEFERLTAALGLDSRVEFCGRLPDPELVRAYQEADLFILPSINSNEAFGIVLTEALACGVPVIASDLPGVRRVFANYQEGLLAEPASVSDLTKKLEFILADENRRQEMSRAARRLAEKKYGLEMMRESLLSLFRENNT